MEARLVGIAHRELGQVDRDLSCRIGVWFNRERI